MCRWFVLFATIVSCVSSATTLMAREYRYQAPIPTVTQNPLYLQNLQLKPMGARVPDRGHIVTQLTTNYSNMYEVGNGTQLTHLLDMELLRMNINAEVGLGDGFSAGVDLPFLHFEGGSLDSFVQDFHHAFGFPNGGRQFRPHGAFAYRVANNGTIFYSANQEDFSLGDISIYFTKHLLDETKAKPAMAFRFVFKLPTGQASQGIGSGMADYGFQFAFEKEYKRLFGALNAGYFVISGNSALDAYTYDLAFGWATTIGFHISRPVAAIVQFSGSTPLLKGMGRTTWDSYPMELAIGLGGNHATVFGSHPLIWKVAFVEDPNANGPSVDFSGVMTVGTVF